MTSFTRSSNRATSDSCPVEAVGSMDPDLLLKNAVSTVELAKAFGLPIVHSTVNVASGRGKPTLHALGDLLEDNPPIDRTTIAREARSSSWRARPPPGDGSSRALWTEMCMALLALDALSEGYGVYPVVDVIGGTSVEAHRGALERVVQAGAVVRGLEA